MKYSLSKLKSGLKVLVVPMAGLESATVTVWVKTGSRNEDKRINGISHFLEHIVFKGSKKRPTAKEISVTLDSFGGEFNAATSKDWTFFYIKSSKERIETGMDVLSDMVINPILDPTEIEREKGTIIQELAMYEDTPMINVSNVFEEVIFPGNPLGWEVAGKPENVKIIKRNDFVQYRDLHYHPENMLVTVSGGISEKKILSLVEKYFGGLKNESTKKGTTGKVFKVTQTKAQVKVKYKKTDQAHFVLGYIGDGRGYKGRFPQSVLSAILTGGMSSRIFTEIRERRGLAYGVKPNSDKYAEVGYVGLYAGTDPKKAPEAIKVALDQFYGLASGKFPIGNKELKKAKEYIKGHIALSLEDTNAVNDFFGEQALFLPTILTPEDMYKKIDAVSVDEVLFEAKRLFDPKKVNLAVIGPFRDNAAFNKLL